MVTAFGQVTGPTGNTGDVGPAGPMGPTGASGVRREYPYNSVSADGILSHYDERVLRAFLPRPCNTEDSSTTGLKSLVTKDDYYDTQTHTGALYSAYPWLCCVIFEYAQTTPLPISFRYRANDAGTIVERVAPLYINGASTSASNPFLWAAGSIILFTIQATRAYFMAYVGNDRIPSKLMQNAPFYHYMSNPAEADLPVRPCFYHVAADNGWYYCNGLA